MSNIPHKYQVDFARRKGNVPYPCFYCAHNSMNELITDEHNIVKEFGYDEQEDYEPVPQICGAGLHKPTGYADCKYIYPVALPSDYHRWYSSEKFEFFTREYMMEMLTDINCNRYIRRSVLIGRARRGYNTREQRLKELIEGGFVDVSYDVDCNECYSLTEYGQQIADAIADMLDQYILVKEHGEPMGNYVVKEVFEFIRSHSDCVAKQIYDHFDRKYDDLSEAEVPMALDCLVMAGYVEPIYNDDFTRISYNTTQKGILRWRAMYVDRQESDD